MSRTGAGCSKPIGKGTYGIIIDGIDEGRAKTTDKAFEAFLDNIAHLCEKAPNTSFVLLGRTEILAECWLYLSYKEIPTGLVSIDAFGIQGAREYVDVFTDGLASSHTAEYVEVRDSILKLLRRAFGENPDGADESFLSFIGYPPVLDAIVTLLTKERNYHRIQKELEGQDANNVEINLLYRISSYILRREKEQKVLPSILEPLIDGMPGQIKDRIKGQVFSDLEQCTRLVAYTLGRQSELRSISEPPINEKYEAALVSWLPEHPFLSGRHFRNAVFESVALAMLIASQDPELVRLALEYIDSNRQNYHLIYFLDQSASDKNIPITCLRAIIGSSMEFRSTTTSIEIHVDGSRADDLDAGGFRSDGVETEIEIHLDNDREQSKTYFFRSKLGGVTTVALGRRLSTAYVDLPIEVTLAGSQDVELTAPVEISALRVVIATPTLILRHAMPSAADDYVLLEA